MTVGLSARALVVGLLVVTAAIYASGLDGAFVIDDRTFFVENDDLTRLGLGDALTVFARPTNAWGDWQPIRDLAFVVEHRAFGRGTIGYHVVSLALYWIACGLAFLLVRRLQGRNDESPGSRAAHWGAAAIATGIFAAHPVHVEAVAYVCGQKELLFAVFTLASVSMFDRVFDEPGRRAGWLAGAVACYGLALLSKQTAIVLLLLVPLLWALADRRRRPRATPSALFWAAVNVPAAIWMLRSREAFQTLWRTNSEVTATPLLERIPLALKVLGAHARLAVWPHPLSFGYPFDGSPSPDANLAAGILALALLGLAAWGYRRDRAVLFGVATFLVFLVPVLQLHGSLNNASIDDCYLFLPVLGVALLAERVARSVLRERLGSVRAWAGAGTALVLLGAVLTARYVPAFEDDVAVTRNSYERFPGWSRAPFELAYSLVEAGRTAEARTLVAREPSLDSPPWVRPYLEGWATLVERRPAEALTALRTAAFLAEAGGYYPFPDIPLGRALAEVGLLDEAEGVLRRALSSPIYQPLEAFHARELLEEIRRRRAGHALGEQQSLPR